MRPVKLTLSLCFSLFILLVPLWGQKTYTIAVDYDNLGRVDSISHPITGVDQTYTSTPSGRHETVSYDGIQVISESTYNKLKALTNLSISSYQGFPASSVVRTYDRLNRMLSLRVNSGTTVYNATNIRYSDAGFISSYSRSDAGHSGPINFGYNNRGQLTSYAIGGASTVYDYDRRGNLTGRDALTVGNYDLTALSLSFGADNQVSGWDYDGNGRLIADDDWEYVYNDLEMLETVYNPLSGLDEAHYLYDSGGNRVRETYDDKVVYSVRNGSGRLVSQEIYQTRLDGDMDRTVKDFVYHNGQVILTVTTHSDDSVTRKYHFRDRLGNPALVRDEINGFSTGYFEFSPFGSQIRQQAEDGSLTHQFTGHERDIHVGLDYMIGRHFSYLDGRFLQPDPAFAFDPINPDTFNLYAYVENNPVNGMDPDGQIGLLGALVGGGVDLGLQLWKNGGDFSAVDYKSVAFSTVTGAVGGPGFSALKGLGVKGSAKLIGKEIAQEVIESESGVPVANLKDAADTVKNFKNSGGSGFGSGGGPPRGSGGGDPKLLPAGKWQPGDFAEGKLDSHFRKHAHEWGAGNITKTAYLKRARDLLSKDIDGDILGFTDQQGWIFRYNRRTNEIAIAKPNGTIETLFRPKRGLEYYNEQVEKYGKQ